MTWTDVWVYALLIIMSIEVGIFTIALLWLTAGRLRIDIMEWLNSRRIEKMFRGARRNGY